ncbi:MAG: polyphosphate kinase 2 [Burkholderiales bacterium]
MGNGSKVGKKVPRTQEAGNQAKRLGKEVYYERLEPLQVELNHLARWIQHSGRRLVVVFEGRDAAGKGGVINAISECLNPRQCHVVALSKPDEVEQAQWYFQRYVAHLPAAGHITLFDRSWYNRAGVEKVMGFCTEPQVQHFLAQAPVFEKMLTDDGILLLKYWLTVDQAEQERRFAERRADPLKRWKLSPIDLQARDKYLDYGQARDEMLLATHTRDAPWTLVDFNDQRRGRLTLIHHLLDQLPDCDVPEHRLKWPVLRHEPLRETFTKRFRPIPSV